MADAREHLALVFRLQGAGCRHGGSEFYGDLCELLAANAEAGGAVIDAMGEFALEEFERVYHLRLLAGLHRMALNGEAPELRAHYPSTGGDGDVRAAWPAIERLLREHPATVDDALHSPLQTNEVGRSASLASGLAHVAASLGHALALDLLEIGSSAGLNLRLDRYFYDAQGRQWGDPQSPLRFVDCWDGGQPPFDPATTIGTRRGCDLAPIDLTTPGTDVKLLSFVWPGQTERFHTLRAALEIAHHAPVDIDREAVDTWLPARLAQRRDRALTVVFHSIVWQYLPDETRASIVRTLDDAGRAATASAPLAYLRLEPDPRMVRTELRLTTWPGSDEVVLAHAGFHAGRVTWLV